MPDTTLDQKLKAETASITVDSYQKVASVGGWSGGGRTLWAISTVGAIAGAGIGLVAPFFPLVVGTSSLATAAGAIGASVATFASAGMAMGFGSGLMLGRISGTAAAIAEEQEKRMKVWTARQMLQEHPGAHIVPDAPKAAEPKKSRWQRIKDNYRTYINPGVGLAMTAVGVAGGLLIAAAFLYTGGATGPIMPALGALTGMGAEAFTAEAIAAAPAAFVAYTAGVAGAFGALWNFNFPKITSEVTHFFGDLINGKYIGREWGPAPAKEPAKAVAPEQSAEQERNSAFRERIITERSTTVTSDLLPRH